MNSGDAQRLGEEAARRLARTGRCDIGPGLTDAEFARIERDHEFEFAADHRAFLAAGLPLSTPAPGRRSPWPDWRGADPGDLRERLGWPVEGALFDVEPNARWHPSWGQRPAGTSQALTTARQHLSRAPKMIPVCSHRYLPAGRGTYGHPVLSIYQTDIIVYGTDLADYIDTEEERDHYWDQDGNPSNDRDPDAGERLAVGRRQGGQSVARPEQVSHGVDAQDGREQRGHRRQ